jgi:hypothetical protein
MKSLPLFVIVLVISSLFLAACGSGIFPKSTPTSSAVPPTWTSVPSETPKPTQTLEPSATATFTSTATLPPTATITPTPAPEFAKFKVFSFEFPTFGSRIGILIPGLKSLVKVTMDGKSFDCTMDDLYKEKMFCVGPTLPMDKDIKVLFSLPGNNQPLYEGYTYLASSLFITPIPPGVNMDLCADRGKNVSCETEIRENNAGEPCKVSTCVDACGYFYSINTCPDTPGP